MRQSRHTCDRIWKAVREIQPCVTTRTVLYTRRSIYARSLEPLSALEQATTAFLMNLCSCSVYMILSSAAGTTAGEAAGSKRKTIDTPGATRCRWCGLLCADALKVEIKREIARISIALRTRSTAMNFENLKITVLSVLLILILSVANHYQVPSLRQIGL